MFQSSYGTEFILDNAGAERSDFYNAGTRTPEFAAVGIGSDDRLEYRGDTVNAVQMTLAPTTGFYGSFDVYLTGGEAYRGEFNSMEVYARSIEIFDLTDGNDRVDIFAVPTDPSAIHYGVTLYAGNGHDQIRMTANDDVVYGQDGNDDIRGMLGNDRLDGGAGNDFIVGGHGDDLIIGSEGSDTLIGGEGADTFMFERYDGAHVITDLSTEDAIQLNWTIATNYTFSFDNGITTIHFGSTDIALSGFGALTADNFDITRSGPSSILRLKEVQPDPPAETPPTLVVENTPIVPTEILASEWTDLMAAQYIASYPDLIAAFGLNFDAARNHYQQHGMGEGRKIDFDTEQYLANYTDLQNAFGDNLMAATQHFITNGHREGRTDSLNITDALAGAEVSSQWDGNHGVDKVLDGDRNTFNHTAAGDNAAAMAFDLGDDFALDQIHIVNRNDGAAWHQAIVNGRLNGATVEAYDDGVEVWSGTLTAAVDQNFHLGGVVADTVVINAAANQYLHIAEVDIFGDHVF